MHRVLVLHTSRVFPFFLLFFATLTLVCESECNPLPPSFQHQSLSNYSARRIDKLDQFTCGGNVRITKPPRPTHRLYRWITGRDNLKPQNRRQIFPPFASFMRSSVFLCWGVAVAVAVLLPSRSLALRGLCKIKLRHPAWQ